MAGLTETYLQTLRGGLAFDPHLAGRICAEVEEHLADIVEREGGGSDAERRAIERMGDPRALAADMARAAMPKRMKLTWRTVALSALAVFLAMRLRNVLIPPEQIELAAAHFALAVDRFAFGVALAAGAFGWYVTRPRGHWLRGTPTVVPAYLCSSALTVSSAAGCYAFAAALFSLGWGATMLVPALAVVAEVTVLAIAFRDLRDLTRQARSA